MYNMDVKDKFNHYLAMVEEDLETARLLLDNERILPCLFYCSLSVEKAFKAAYYTCQKPIPDSGHSLKTFAADTCLKGSMDDALNDILKKMENMNKNSRYPLNNEKMSFEECKEIYRKAEVLKCWIIEQINMRI